MSRDTGNTADVRMHGFRQRSEISAAQGWIDRHASPLGAETVRSTMRQAEC